MLGGEVVFGGGRGGGGGGVTLYLTRFIIHVASRPTGSAGHGPWPTESRLRFAQQIVVVVVVVVVDVVTRLSVALACFPTWSNWMVNSVSFACSICVE